MTIPMTIPMSAPDITAAERAAVADVLATPTLSLGPRLSLFERKLAACLGVPHAVGVSSGTAGLHLALLAAGVGPGDLVLTTPFSFVASANCILYTGARPVFVDVDARTLTLDPEALERTLRTGRRRRWKAVIPVHVFGQPADMDPILELARRYGLAVIEDACEALGAAYRGRSAGTLGDAGVFGFYPNKQLTTGEGGMVVLHDPAWDSLLRSLRNQGRDVFDAWLSHSRLGYNYRLDELSAALGAVQVDRLAQILAARERVAGWYGERLEGIERVALPVAAEWTTQTSWFVYVIRLANREERDRVIRELEHRGIPSRPYFPPIHLQPFYRERFGFKRGAFPVTEGAGDTCLALPFSGTMSAEQVDVVCGALAEILYGPAVRRASA